MAPTQVPNFMRSLAPLLVAFVAPGLFAQSVRLNVDAGSKITILGTSNVHKWDCSTSSFTTTLEALPAPPAGGRREVTRLRVIIPVASLDCGEKKMNENLRKAMNAEAQPYVTFEMTSYDATPVKAEGGYGATVKGSLSINGVTKPIQIKATVSPDGKGVRAEGSTEIHTPDYGVAPVKAMLGAIRTGATVTVVLTLIATQP